MKSFVALCVVLAACLSISNAFKCDVVQVGSDDFTIYSFCDLYSAVNNYTGVSNGGKITNGTIAFGLGQNTQSCNGTAEADLATFWPGKDNSTLCRDIPYSEPAVSYFDDTDPTAGLVLYYDPNITGANYTIYARLSCNPDSVAKTVFDNYTYNGSTTTFTFYVDSSNSCPNKVLSKLAYFVSKYQGVFVALAVIFGLFICFFGLSMLKYTIFLIAALGGTFISATLFISLIGYDSPTATFWLIFAVCVIIGCVLGWVAVKIETLGFVVLGGVLGVVGGQLLFTAALAPAGAKVAIYWVTVVVCAIIGAAVAYKFWRSFVIIATGILGAFLVVKSIGGLIGNFPSADTLSRGFHFPAVVYAYIAAIALLAVAGMYVQHKRKKAAEVEEDADVHGYQKVMAGYNA